MTLHKFRSAIAVVFLVSATLANAQTGTYMSHSGEIIFSMARIKSNGNEVSSNLRFSPVFNLQSLVNHNTSPHFGIFYGLTIRNVGFVYEPTKDTLKKFRTYNLGLPIGIKVGNVDGGGFLFGGYEFEVPFNYKEKTFVDEIKKDVFSIWFSNRVNPYTQSVFVGYNTRKGTAIKLKYYIDPFFNSNFSETINGVKVQPFKNLQVNVFYLSICFNMFDKPTPPKWRRRNQVETTTAL